MMRVDGEWLSLPRVLQRAESPMLWHKRRSTGQLERFGRVRACGSESFFVVCRGCNHTGEPHPLGCDVVRLCPQCSLVRAKKSRARFGFSRGRVLLDGLRAGLTTSRQRFGRFTEKLLTLTVPHFEWADCRGDVRKKSEAWSSSSARVHALYLAWPRFLRSVKRYFSQRQKEGDREALSRLAYARYAEVTFGADGAGHPHFHVWLWSRFLPWEKLRVWWTKALEDVGVPFKARDELAVVHVKQIRAFDVSVVRELMKGGRKSAMGLSRLSTRDVGTGETTVADYASGWSCSDLLVGDLAARSAGLCLGAERSRSSTLHLFGCAPSSQRAEFLPSSCSGRAVCGARRLSSVGRCADDRTADAIGVVAAFYGALEGKRLDQASRGFFAEWQPAACPCCELSSVTCTRVDGTTFNKSYALFHLVSTLEAESRAPP